MFVVFLKRLVMFKNIVTLPNALSLLRILLTPLFVVAYLRGGYCEMVAIALFTLAALTDSCDGYLARRYGLTTKFGAFLDPIADKILVIATLWLFVWQGFIHWLALVLIVGRDLFVTGLRMKLIMHGTSLKTSNLGKWKTAAQFCAMYLFFLAGLLNQGNGSGELQQVVFFVATVVMWGVVAVSLYSGIDYLLALKRMKKHE